MGQSPIRMSPKRLQSRIDATYYSRKFVDNERRLLNGAVATSKLQSLVTGGRRAVYFSTSTLEREDAPTDWVPFLTSEDFGPDGFHINLAAKRYVSPEFADNYPNGHLRENEILVKVKGPNQIAAYNGRCPDTPALVSGTIWGAVVNLDKVDPHFLVAALSSPYAVLARTRLRTNLNVEFLSPSDLLLLDLPIPTKSDVQRYIGDKVRQAERLRNQARRQEARFEDLIREEYPDIDARPSSVVKHSRAKPAELNGRLNAGAFYPDRVHARSYLLQNGGRRVAEFARIETPVTSNYGPEDAYVGLDSIGSSCGTLIPSTIEAEGVVGSVRVLPAGPAISKLRPYLNKVAYIPNDMAGALASTELLCLACEDESLNWYAYGVLHTASTVRQLNPISTGSTHPRVTREDVLDTIVPWVSDPRAAGVLLSHAQHWYFMSDRLISSAKVLVEGLIDGHVTETELAQSQAKLEQGDDSTDRTILRRLYEGGIDAMESKPLFPDLDAYYATLRQTAETDRRDGEG